MMIHVAQNPEKTRRAVATGKRVVFYRRKRKERGYAEPVPVLRRDYRDHDVAKAAADAWALETKIH